MGFMSIKSYCGPAYEFEECDFGGTYWLPKQDFVDVCGLEGFMKGSVVYHASIKLARYSADGYLDSTGWNPLDDRTDVETFVDYYGDESEFDADVAWLCAEFGFVEGFEVQDD